MVEDFAKWVRLDSPYHGGFVRAAHTHIFVPKKHTDLRFSIKTKIKVNRNSPQIAPYLMCNKRSGHASETDRKMHKRETRSGGFLWFSFLTAQMSVFIVFCGPHLPLAFQFVCVPGGGGATNKWEGKWKVRTTKNNQNRHQCRL